MYYQFLDLPIIAHSHWYRFFSLSSVPLAEPSEVNDNSVVSESLSECATNFSSLTWLPEEQTTSLD